MGPTAGAPRQYICAADPLLPEGKIIRRGPSCPRGRDGGKWRQCRSHSAQEGRCPLKADAGGDRSVVRGRQRPLGDDSELRPQGSHQGIKYWTRLGERITEGVC